MRLLTYLSYTHFLICSFKDVFEHPYFLFLYFWRVFWEVFVIILIDINVEIFFWKCVRKGFYIWPKITEQNNCAIV